MRERKRTGDRLRLKAADWNSFLDAADRVLGGKNNRRDNTLSVQKGNQDILCKNMSGSDLEAFSIVGLDTVVVPEPAVINEFFQQQHQIEVVNPKFPDHLGKWGVLQEPLKANATGRVRVAGIAIAKVTGDEPEGDYLHFAEIEDDNVASLQFTHRGTAEILWKDTASEWAILRIGNAWRPDKIKATLSDGNEFEEETKDDPHTGTDIKGIDQRWMGDSDVELYNPLKIKLWVGCDVFAHYNCEEEEWQIYGATSDKVVHGIKRNKDECKFEKLDGKEGWNDWDENGEAKWVTTVYLEGCQLYYDTDCVQGNDAGRFDWIEDIVFDGCTLYAARKCGDYYPVAFLNFVQSVTYNSESCKLLVTGCSGSSEIPLDFVTDIYVGRGGEALVYDKNCVTDITIIEFTDCEE